VRAALKQSMPNADIHIEGVGDGVILTGTAASPIEAQQANDLAAASPAAPTRSSIRSRSAAATR
jgi:Flp pilus assembly protein, secretin CpaC